MKQETEAALTACASHSTPQQLLLEETTVVDLIKVDIEGFEHEALLGSPRVFESGRIRALALELHPTILAERSKNPRDVEELLERCGYSRSDTTENAVWLAPATPAQRP